jgi:hypothetical protein
MGVKVNSVEREIARIASKWKDVFEHPEEMLRELRELLNKDRPD